MPIRYSELRPYVKKLVRRYLGAPGTYTTKKYSVLYTLDGHIFIAVADESGRFGDWCRVTHI